MRIKSAENGEILFDYEDGRIENITKLCLTAVANHLQNAEGEFNKKGFFGYDMNDEIGKALSIVLYDRDIYELKPVEIPEGMKWYPQ